MKEGSMGRERNEGDEDAREKSLPVCGSACSPRLGVLRSIKRSNAGNLSPCIRLE